MENFGFIYIYIFILFSYVSTSSNVNLAYNQFSNQSSTDTHGNSFQAVDGKFDSVFRHPFYGALTKNEYRPWFILLLDRAYLVKTIRLLGGKSNCQRLTNLFIKTSLTPETFVVDFNKFRIFAYITQEILSSRSLTVCSIEYHYIRTVLMYLDKTEKLNIYELEIYNIDSVATNKNSSQSTRTSFASANDGHSNWDYSLGNRCSHTEKVKNSWWKVDLGEDHIVYTISVIGRYNLPHQTRDVKFTVSYDDEDPAMNPTGNCGQYNGNLPTYHTMKCKKWTIGRYLSAYKYTTDIQPLVLCEVDVFGQRNNKEIESKLIIHNTTEYVILNATMTGVDCNNIAQHKFEIQHYKLKNFMVKMNGIGIKEFCENNDIILTTLKNTCKLVESIDGYEKERDLLDTCTFECQCLNNSFCEFLSIFYKINKKIPTKEIFIFIQE